VKKKLSFFIIVACCILCIQAQTVVTEGTVSPTKNISTDTILKDDAKESTISLADYKNLKVLWESYFASVLAFDDSVTADPSLYQQELLRCLKDSSAHSTMQPEALGEVLFYKYFAKKSSLMTIADNLELNAEIYDFLSFEYSPEAMVENTSERLVIGNFFSFLEKSSPNTKLGLGSGLHSFLKGIAPNFDTMNIFKMDKEYEKIEIYRAINKLNNLQNEKPIRNTWIETINDPVVWYMLQNCIDYRMLKEEWNKAGFSQTELDRLDKGYLSNRSQNIYHIQKIINALSMQDPLMGISTEQLLSTYAQSALNQILRDDFMLYLFSESDAKELDAELATYQLALDLWISRINALAFVEEKFDE